MKGAPTAAEIEHIQSRHAFWRVIGILAILLGVPLLIYGFVLSDTKEIVFGGLAVVLGFWRYWIHRPVRIIAGPKQ